MNQNKYFLINKYKSLINNLTLKIIAYQANIDWCWNNNDHPTRPECLVYVVREVPPVLRGNSTGSKCVVNAIRANRGNQVGSPLRWLQTGQCHN